jgi:predicted DNA-binding protein
MSGTGEKTEITIVIDRETDLHLSRMANQLGREKNDVANEALVEWLEDLEDILAADQVLRDGYVRFSREEVRDRLGLER